MKTNLRLLSVLAIVATSQTLFASGADSGAYQGALFNGDSPRFFDTVHSGGPRLISVGVTMEQQKRKLQSDFGSTEDLKVNHLAGVLGLDITKWFTIYGGGGEADVSSLNGNHDSNGEWLAGGTIRALDYMVLEPWNDTDQYWVGVDLNSFYRNTQLETGNDTTSLSEVFASATLSFYSKPERVGTWDRIGVYVGPAFSTLTMGNKHEDQAFGLLGGIILNPNPNMSVKLEAQNFDSVGIAGSFTFHF